MRQRFIVILILGFVLPFLPACKKCTTCKVANDGSGNEFTYPEYCSRKKEDIESFKEGVKNEAARIQTNYSCNDK